MMADVNINAVRDVTGMNKTWERRVGGDLMSTFIYRLRKCTPIFLVDNNQPSY